jgi:hypothetical protein
VTNTLIRPIRPPGSKSQFKISVAQAPRTGFLNSNRQGN